MMPVTTFQSQLRCYVGVLLLATFTASSKPVFPQYSGDLDTGIYLTVTPKPQVERYENAFHAVTSAVIVADGAIAGDMAIVNFRDWAERQQLDANVAAAPGAQELVIHVGIGGQQLSRLSLPSHPHPDVAEGYVLKIAADGDRVEAVLRGNALAGMRHGLQSLRQLILRWRNQTIVREAELLDWPSVRYRFVKRASGYWMEHAVRYKLNGATVPIGTAKEGDLAAAKAQWAGPVKAAQKRGLGLLGMVTMGNIYRGAPEAVARRAALFVALHELGYTHLAIMNDDKMTLLDAEGQRLLGDYSKAQLHYLKAIKTALRKAGYSQRLGFLPNHYVGTDVEPETREQLHGHLTEDVAFFWAGDYKPGLAATIPQLKRVREQVGAQQLWYYTNWPQVSGPWYAKNYGACRVQEFGSDGLVELVTVSTTTYPRVFPTSFITNADLLWNADGYDPDRALMRAVKEVVGPDSFAPFYALFKYLDTTAPQVDARNFGPMYAAESPTDRLAIIEARCAHVDRLVAACRKTPIANEPGPKKILDFLANRRDRDLKRLADEERREQHIDGRKQLMCPIVSTAPKLDGTLDDVVWQSAATATGFTALRGGKEAPHQTEVRIMRDESQVYLAVTCHETHLDDPEFLDPGYDFPMPINNSSDGYLWWYESVEMFFDPGADGRDVCQVIINPWGLKEGFHYTSQRFGYYGIENQVRRNFPVSGSVSRTASAWTIECAIPLGTFANPANGKWGFNVARNRRLRVGNGMKYSTWTPLGWGFQDAAKFGHLTFATK